jgi:ubiquinone/menaquinone biosynthesis C-methylase UbiE
MLNEKDIAAFERQRIQAEYSRRERQINRDLYAPWQPAELFVRSGRKFTAAKMLHQAGIFPRAHEPCLEVGCGSQGWLGDLITWGVCETALHGIELDPDLVGKARSVLPMADLRVGDATDLPWDNNMFRLVIASTVFTSILDTRVRQMVADEITRVLAPGGALLWYDFAVNNPRNRHVRKVTRKELRELFPRLDGRIESVTLAPALARFAAPRSLLLATILEAMPFFRTHLLSLLVKNP